MAAGAASREIFQTIEPPPISSLHRFRSIEPITIWVTCRRRAKSQSLGRAVPPDLVPLGTRVGDRMPQRCQLVAGKPTDVSARLHVENLPIGLDPVVHPLRPGARWRPFRGPW